MRLFHFSVRSTLILLLFSFRLLAQDHPVKKYPSLLWEITGNGLKKPSYLFGTMHISNKMVFHLSDSFYVGIRNADVVAIELNPELWQHEIPRINKQSLIYRYFNATYYTDFLNENSMTEGGYLEPLQQMLRMEPALNDALLYRNQTGMDNFEEDTYLDLYIYQTGKKLGKQATGVETFIGSQRMMIEAYVDMANEKNKKSQRQDINYYQVNQDLQDAYRRGDLDMLDSLNKITSASESFSEKFLYKRNEIQANSMDSIMKTQSLFVGVGAAHLPGKRGVIELLRARGYTLRPIYMQDRDGTQKEYIDSLSVPITFAIQHSADSFLTVAVPGDLNDISANNATILHYADMANGAYYLISRIKTNILFNGYDAIATLHTVDSLLYENIPGKIVSKNSIIRNGYKGWDIINRTRKGDLQRYQIFVTPSELVIFKMGGKGSYVNGKEADEFFGSIAMKENDATGKWVSYAPAYGGFAVKMPGLPKEFYTQQSIDNLPAWKYEAIDPASGDIYTIFKKNIYSYDFAAPDTFDLSLMEESYGSAKNIDKQILRKVSNVEGKPVLDAVYRLKNNEYSKVRFLLNGPHYYMLALRTKDKNKDAGMFFNSFTRMPYKYTDPEIFSDTILHYKVSTPVKPEIDSDVMEMLNYARKNNPELRDSTNYNNAPINNYANFVSEKTGEVIILNAYKYPDYYFIKDSAKFWNEELQYDSSMVVVRKERLNRAQGTDGWLIYVADTASSRVIKYQVMMRGMNILTAFTMVDTTMPESEFIRRFYTSLDFINTAAAPALFDSKVAAFEKAYYDTDSLVRRRAKNALPSIYFGKEGFPVIKKMLAGLDNRDNDYYDIKTKLINELGYINDSTVAGDVAHTLENIYKKSGDTTVFQNSVFRALARQKTGIASSIFKDLILQDPPVFEDKYEYEQLFAPFSDSLKLAAGLYPDLMNLATIEDYKEPVRSLLGVLVDSGYIKSEAYENYAGNIYFDAKIALKKIQNASEEAIGQNTKEQNRYIMLDTFPGVFSYYTTLLMPFYDTNPNLPKFFERMMQSPDRAVRLHTALLLLKNKKAVPDSLWNDVAQKEEFREYLYTKLKQAGHPELFPGKYKTSDGLSSSMMAASLANVMDSLVLIRKQPYTYNGTGGSLYFYKYKLKNNSNWFTALNGVVYNKNNDIASTRDLFRLTGTVFSETESVAEQMNKELKKLLISKQPSGRAFYNTDDGKSTATLPYQQ